MESKFENVYIQNIEISKNGIFDEMTWKWNKKS
jgi:hypothetical protein